MNYGKWREKCVANYDDEARAFFKDYFASNDKKCLLVGGAGFDPRSNVLVDELVQLLGKNLFVFLYKENRPDPDEYLSKMADENLNVIYQKCHSVTLVEIDIFADDGAVIGGVNAIKGLNGINVSGYTDVIIDMSALTVGISFPVIRYFYELSEKTPINLHTVVVSNPGLDGMISSDSNDVKSYVHGFPSSDLKGEGNEKAKLWLPIVSQNKINQFKIINDGIRFDDICPILPFPSKMPKSGDYIAYEIYKALQSGWDSKSRLNSNNFLYADEWRPLDIYRSILRIQEDRLQVFHVLEGGSTIILSPLGSKIPSLGLLLAAMECDFPIAYVEAIAYKLEKSTMDQDLSSESKISHLWIAGDAYLN